MSKPLNSCEFSYEKWLTALSGTRANVSCRSAVAGLLVESRRQRAGCPWLESHFTDLRAVGFGGVARLDPPATLDVPRLRSLRSSSAKGVSTSDHTASPRTPQPWHASTSKAARAGPPRRDGALESSRSDFLGNRGTCDADSKGLRPKFHTGVGVSSGSHSTPTVRQRVVRVLTCNRRFFTARFNSAFNISSVSKSRPG